MVINQPSNHNWSENHLISFTYDKLDLLTLDPTITFKDRWEHDFVLEILESQLTNNKENDPYFIYIGKLYFVAI